MEKNITEIATRNCLKKQKIPFVLPTPEMLEIKKKAAETKQKEAKPKK